MRDSPPEKAKDACQGVSRKSSTSISEESVSDETNIVNPHSRILADRWLRGELTPFECAICGGLELDPHGRNGKHEHLCERCSQIGGGQ